MLLFKVIILQQSLKQDINIIVNGVCWESLIDIPSVWQLWRGQPPLSTISYIKALSCLLSIFRSKCCKQVKAAPHTAIITVQHENQTEKLGVGNFECKLKRSHCLSSFWQLNWAFPSVTVTEHRAVRSLAGNSRAPPLHSFQYDGLNPKMPDYSTNRTGGTESVNLQWGQEKEKIPATPPLPLVKGIAPALWSISCLVAQSQNEFPFL